ncbi:hypothetical protein [Melittangium boletus]|uniref:Uncharacterized protein n=1 Tax=Melittangium boletus DSM 14713 TaxID=1294270 RepID=A0A250IML9_9BACT|nr:hypothetical protein [Melittangium boletus]ATB32984.1 hypothetical protein MEBOL_006473 [Melittangium boletus DSM 14713]
MKNRGISSAVWLGITLCALGHGDVAKASEPAEQREAQGAVGDMRQTSMGLSQFQSLAVLSDQAGRCVQGISAQEAAMELDYGYSMGLISYDAFTWGHYNDYYPVIDRRNNVVAVCKFGASMSLAQFQALAASSDQAGRCVHGIGNLECVAELDYGLSVDLITLAAYHWGISSGYYPVIDRYNRIQAVCGCW